MTARSTISICVRYILCLVGVATILVILFSFPVRIDYGLVSANTGSRHMYSEWVFCLRTNEVYLESPIEAHLRDSGRMFDHRWISYAGTGRNVLGMAVTRSHGSPGAVLDFSPHLFDYVRSLAPEKKDIMALELNSGDEQKVLDRMAKLTLDYYESLSK